MFKSLSKRGYKLFRIREKLHTLVVDNGRILDLHHPTRGVVSLLIHKGYLDVLTSTLTKHELILLDDFDPLDPTNFKDPAFTTLTTGYALGYDMNVDVLI
ncbi:hypothetical protein INT48_009045 [Thamnidium elegans]|uniref:Uncharacterized protein n=1 Tax=Thamnidium elegans TaxID=101142 RepID=A0A8H7SZZ3_9FUNG|nr:hypothetical protein INT48_009045 [Thamnidium elegans]